MMILAWLLGFLSMVAVCANLLYRALSGLPLLGYSAPRHCPDCGATPDRRHAYHCRVRP